MKLEKSFQFLFYAFSFTLPFIGFNIPKYLLGGLILLKITLVVLNFQDYSFEVRKNKHLLLSILILPLYLAITLAYSTNFDEGLSNVGRYSFCFIMPFLFLFPENQKIVKKNMLLSFAYGVLVLIVLNFILLGYFWDSPESFAYSYSKFYYRNLAGLVKTHPGYYSLNIAIAIFITIHYISSKAKWLIVPPFIIVLISLSSRSIIVTTSFVLFIFFLRYLLIKKEFKYIPFFVLIIFVSIFILTKTLLFNRLSNMVSTFANNISNISAVLTDHQNRLDENLIRLFIFKYSYDTITKDEKSIIFGYGIGDYKNVLMEKYEEEKFVFGLHYKYNSHNQYLTITLISGLVGLLIYLFHLFLPLLFNNRDLVYNSILFLLLIYGLTESYFVREAGILVTTFFISLFLFEEKRNKYSNN